MNPTFSWSTDIEKHRAVVALPIPACLQSPPGDTKAAALPEKKAEVAIAAPVDALIIVLVPVYVGVVLQSTITGVPHMNNGVII